MANVNIPTTSVDPNERDVGKLVKQLLNAYIILTEELTFLLNNLDTRNLNEVDGDILVTGTITGDKVAANTITAGNMIVDQLSAISANLGKMLAGEIYGTYIATRESGYPRAEMSNTDNMFGAYQSGSSSAKIEAQGDYSGSPELTVNSPTGRLTMYQQGAQSLVLGGGSAGLTISGQRVTISPAFSGGAYVSFSQLFDLDDGRSLLQKLDSKMDKP